MSVSLVYIGVIVGALALILGVTLLAMRVARWRRDQAMRHHGAPILVMPLTDASPAPRPTLAREPAVEDGSRRQLVTLHSPVAVRRATPPDWTSVSAEADAGMPSRERAPNAGAGQADRVVPDDDVRRVDGPEPDASRLPDESLRPDVAGPHDDGDTVSTGPFRPGAVRAASPSAHLVSGNQVRYFRAEEGTLEFLPGRLEIVGGDDVGQEIHFARQMGEVDTTMTFGRSEGQPLRHIQLLDATVSRQHARMNWDGQVWQLTNLSATNAAVLNGRPLGSPNETVTLRDGDRIEMGAVVFVFHGR